MRTWHALLLALLLAGPAMALDKGDVAPDFSLPGLDGGIVTLRAARSSGPVVIWFPDVDAGVEAEAAELLQNTPGARVLAIPVAGADRSAAADLAARAPGMTVLHDADGQATFTYTGEFIPGVSPRRNLVIVDASGQVALKGCWPGLAPARIQEALGIQP